jgi:phosphonate transport system ATP-binding protein
MTTATIDVRNLSKTFRNNKRALDGVSVSVSEGEMVALIGASGSGKSTLLRLISGLVLADRSDDSEVRVLRETVQRGGRPGRGIRSLRANVGVIFQQFNLVDRLSLLTNVATGALGRTPRWRGNLGLFTRAEKLHAMRALDRVGMAEHAAQRASTLSGGQQQRGAIARTLVQGARIMLADEPIASLDPKAARRVMDILSQLNRQDGMTVLVSLHQVEYAVRYCPRTLALRDGKLVYDGPSNALTPEFLNELYGSESEELFLPGLTGMTESDPRGDSGPTAPHDIPKIRAVAGG